MENLRPKRPNIILVLVDDMGYSDIGCFGSRIRTPNLDRLAGEGVRFSSAYNCARCCPSRASLLTGLYPHQTGVGHMVSDLGSPGYRGFLNDSCVTIAEALLQSGYRTFMSGKWHVGGNQIPARRDLWNAGDPTHPHPLDRGFERFYGILCGAGSYFRPPTLSRGRAFIEPEGDDYYLTDAITHEACVSIDEAASGKEPFFLYAAYTAPHWPLHALQADIERYRGRYREGWDALRGRRHETLKGMGILDPRWPICRRDEAVPDWHELTPKRREWEDLRMAVYAAQVDAVDRGVGAMISRLEHHGIFDDTLVLFAADNGGCAEFLCEDGHAENYRIAMRDGTMPRVGNRPDMVPGGENSFMSYELPWAHASNSPFRLYKSWVHEGGIATPLIAHWPGGFGAESRGAIRHDPCHFIDIMPTCLEAAAAPYPSEREGKATTPLEGVSLLSAMRGDGLDRREPLFWEHEGNRAVRDGHLKLVSRYPGEWELYELETDRTETDDLAARYRTEVTMLASRWERWAGRVGVVSREEVRERSRRSKRP